MSANDDKHNQNGDAYHYRQHRNDVSRSQQHQHQHLHRGPHHVPDAAIALGAHSSHHQMMWSTNLNPNLMQQQQPPQFLPQHIAAPHMQQPPIPTNAQQQQQQHQHYNDYMYNMHPVQAFVQPTGPAETYSVLPVGHGNFLKVYHCNEVPSINEQPPQQAQPAPQHFPSMPLQHFPMQGLPTGQHRMQQQQPQAPLPPHHQQQFKHHVAGDILHQPTNLVATAATVSLPSPPQPQPNPPPPQQQQQQFFNSYELFSSNPLLPAACDNRNVTLNSATQQDEQVTTNINNNNKQQQVNEGGNSVAVTTTNMIINKLVNNWSPNLTGVAYTQFSAPTSPLGAPEIVEPMLVAQDNVQPQPQQHQHQQQPIQMSTPPITLAGENKVKNEDDTTTTKESSSESKTATSTAGVTDNLLESGHSIENPTKLGNIINTNKNMAPPEAKKRIVAEVKPMRMTYSDVLSKASHAQQQSQNQQQQQNSQNNNNRNGKVMGTASQLLLNSERKNNINSTATTNGTSKKSGEADGRNNKKSPTHDQKENIPNNNNKNNNANKRINANGQVKNINQKTTTPTSISKPTAQPTPPTTSSSSNDIINNNNNASASKKRTTKKSTATTITNTANTNNNINNESIEKDNDFGTRPKVTTSTPFLNTKAAGATSSTNARNRNNANSSLASNSSYSYSTKRNRHSYYGSSSTVAASGVGVGGGGTYGAYRRATNQKYELATKLLTTWCEYALKVLTWLYYLVYDIVVISCSMAYDNLKQYAADAWWKMCYMHDELKQNSNKPGLWWRQFWRRFDARFSKTSRWAFWRRYFVKKTPTTATTETFKGGRLPQTGDEAMYSLLNCKGKNAYSILGVPPDGSQEQIRKHYKKIAVLVHPDKNKQAGAEEAFKVLHRAFELIGEPENRLAYDTSLAEALHAEKSWTEFHDLLSQLHTKITEAANTIRCSTCSLRHPRKLTDRPHYAARECASCKIRHSAREGDIWAESTMLGLRWKYLALMEGKVYDITEWANCQKGALSHLEPNSHMVQYRIVRGAQQQQQQQQQQHQQQQASQQQGSSSQKQQRQPTPGFESGGFSASTNAFPGAAQFAKDLPSSEASLHEFLDNLYSGQNPNQGQSTAYSNSSRRRSRRN